MTRKRRGSTDRIEGTIVRDAAAENGASAPAEEPRKEGKSSWRRKMMGEKWVVREGGI